MQDSTFFVGVIRGKVNAITEEIAKLQKEIDETFGLNKDDEDEEEEAPAAEE